MAKFCFEKQFFRTCFPEKRNSITGRVEFDENGIPKNRAKGRGGRTCFIVAF